tara:strand:- start:197 stop:574 length:378 start_codon:yes stop_codon:yes gene_type:complete
MEYGTPLNEVIQEKIPEKKQVSYQDLLNTVEQPQEEEFIPTPVITPTQSNQAFIEPSKDPFKLNEFLNMAIVIFIVMSPTIQTGLNKLIPKIIKIDEQSILTTIFNTCLIILLCFFSKRVEIKFN